MPNGRPGDHPFTDIVVHGATVLGEPGDSLVREVAAAPGFLAYSDEVARLVEAWDPGGVNTGRLLRLQDIRAKLLGGAG